MMMMKKISKSDIKKARKLFYKARAKGNLKLARQINKDLRIAGISILRVPKEKIVNGK